MSESNGSTFGLRRVWPVAGLLAVVIGIAGFAMMGQDKEQFLQSYLMGWLFWMFLTLGCMGFVLLHHTIRGVWGLSVLRLFEAGSSPLMFALLGLAFIPILANMGSLYEWTNHTFMQSHPALRYKQWYLNPNSFMIRQAVYFAFWIGVSAFLRNSSLKQDETRNEKMAQARMNLSAVCLPVFVIVFTLAVTDWAMSLDAHWFSQIFGAWLLVGGCLTAMALMNLIVMSNSDKEPYKSVMNPGLSRDLGNMMLVFTLLWAYTSLSQFLIIWSGNLPEYNKYYVSRTHGGWDTMGLFLIAGQFLLPFILLLAPRTKAVPGLLGLLALWILLVRVVDTFWILAPFFRQQGVEVHWGLDLVAFGFVGALWVAAFSNRFGQGAIIPAHDARLKEAYQHA